MSFTDDFNDFADIRGGNTPPTPSVPPRGGDIAPTFDGTFDLYVFYGQDQDPPQTMTYAQTVDFNAQLNRISPGTPNVPLPADPDAAAKAAAAAQIGQALVNGLASNSAILATATALQVAVKKQKLDDAVALTQSQTDLTTANAALATAKADLATAQKNAADAAQLAIETQAHAVATQKQTDETKRLADVLAATTAAHLGATTPDTSTFLGMPMWVIYVIIAIIVALLAYFIL